MVHASNPSDWTAKIGRAATWAIFNENFPNERRKEKVDREGLEGTKGEDTKFKDYAKRSELGGGHWAAFSTLL